jgi:hypothetical protein
MSVLDKVIAAVTPFESENGRGPEPGPARLPDRAAGLQ